MKKYKFTFTASTERLLVSGDDIGAFFSTINAEESEEVEAFFENNTFVCIISSTFDNFNAEVQAFNNKHHDLSVSYEPE